MTNPDARTSTALGCARTGVPARLVAVCLLLLASVAVSGCDDSGATETDATDVPTTDVSSDMRADLGPDAARDTGASEMSDAPSICGDRSCSADESAASCPEDCHDGPVFDWDPHGDDLTAMPDDYLTVDDPGSPSGLRVDVTLERMPDLDRFPEGLRTVFAELSQLDGWGTTAPIWIQFNDRLDEAVFPDPLEVPLADNPLIVGWIDDSGALQRIPARIDLSDDKRAIFIRPLQPLPPGRHAVVAVLEAPWGLSGGTLAANRRLESLLDGTATGELARLQERYDEGVAALEDGGHIGAVDEIAAMIVYTTRDTETMSLELADRIAAESWTVTSVLGCRDEATYQVCDFEFESPVVRDVNGSLTVPSDGALPRHTLDGIVYLPLSGPGNTDPRPVVIFGHGLAQSRTTANRAARLLDEGWAVVSLDAPGHGDHPQQGPDDMILAVLEFFGVFVTESFDSFTVEPAVMAGSLMQGTVDKLALTHALADGVDLDGKRGNELSGQNMMYLGVSLGGIMAPHFLALDEHVEAAVIISGAGRVVDVVGDTQFADLLPYVVPPTLDRDDISVLLLAAQTLIDHVDAGAWAPHVSRDRFDGRGGLHVLSAIALDDEIVPNSTSLFLARGLDGVQLEPAILPAGLLELAPPPVAANLDGVTSAFLVLDWINDSGMPDGWEPADHQNVAPSTVGMAAWTHFLSTYTATGVPEVIDPYVALGLTPPR